MFIKPLFFTKPQGRFMHKLRPGWTTARDGPGWPHSVPECIGAFLHSDWTECVCCVVRSNPYEGQSLKLTLKSFGTAAWIDAKIYHKNSHSWEEKEKKTEKRKTRQQ